MRPLNLAILEYFTKVEKACADDVIAALKDTYGYFKALQKKNVLEALMTAEKNDLLVVADLVLDENEELVIYYKTTEESRQTILDYLK